MHFLAVEKKEPFRVGVWQVAASALDFAEAENAAALERLKQCQAANEWPHGYETVRVFDSV